MEAHSKRPKKLAKTDGKALKMFHVEQLWLNFKRLELQNGLSIQIKFKLIKGVWKRNMLGARWK